MKRMKIIDFHTHIGGVKSWYKNLKGTIIVSEKDLLSYMKDRGIEKAVVLPVPRFDGVMGQFIYSSERILRICRFYEELMPFCCFAPQSSMDEDKLNRLIEDYVSKGVLGYGEHKVKLPIDHPWSLEIYKICGEMRLPVLIHVDNDHNYGFEKAFPEMAAKYSKTEFVTHGPGWWRHISANPSSGTYPKGSVKPNGLVDKILSENENVYADISATSGFNALNRDKEYAKFFLEKHRDKILFETDFPGIDFRGGQYGVNGLHLSLLESLGLKDQTLERIVFKNAEKLLKIA